MSLFADLITLLGRKLYFAVVGCIEVVAAVVLLDISLAEGAGSKTKGGFFGPKGFFAGAVGAEKRGSVSL